MHVVEPNETRAVAVEKGRHAIRLEAGHRYVMHDVEVASGRDADAFASIEPLPESPPPLDLAAPPGPAPDGHPPRLIIPFIGGLGDALSFLPVLRTIRRARPDLVFHVTTTPGPAQVFVLTPIVDQVLPYPLTADDWARYHAYLSLEAVHQTGQAPGRPLPETIAAALGMEPPEPVFDLVIPQPSRPSPQPDDAPPIVAIAPGEGESPRAYPHEYAVRLVERLASEGVACIIMGHEDPSRPMREHPPLVTDMRGRTPSVLELSVWLREMDAVVAVDSFVMHLAGVLERPTVGLFAPTAPAHASPYGSVAARGSGLDCAPCHEAGATCPKGYDRCLAWDDEALSPAAVANAVLETLAAQPRHSHFLENVRTSPPAA